MHRDVWIGGGLAALGFATAAIAPSETTADGSGIVGPATLPAALAATIGLFGAALALSGRSRPPTAIAGADAAAGAALRAGALAAALALYALALPVLGYALATVLLTGTVALLFGNRRPAPVLALALLVPAALLLFFERGMLILLPKGVLLP